MMPKRSSKKPRDINQLAASIVQESTAEDESQSDAETEIQEQPDDGKDPNAVALGRKGGKKGGPARAKKLSKERLQEIARKAAQARWQRRGQA